MVRKIFTLVAISTGLALAACNTIAGVGEDVESVGDSVEDCAEAVRYLAGPQSGYITGHTLVLDGGLTIA